MHFEIIGSAEDIETIAGWPVVFATLCVSVNNMAPEDIKMVQPRNRARFALCIENRDCDDLEKGKVYQIHPDDTAAQEGYLREVDESEEDYLYPQSFFVLLKLPKKAQEALSVRT